MKTIRTPFQLDHTGRVSLTDDPTTILEQQITDILVTYRGQRVMRPDHGADLEGFIFAPLRTDVLNLKADEIHAILSAGIAFGEIIAVRMSPVEGYDSSVRLSVYYRLSATSGIKQLDRIISGFVTEETAL